MAEAVIQEQKKTNKKARWFYRIIDLLQKSSIDDVWNLCRGFLPSTLINMVGPFLTGGIGLFSYLGESYKAGQKVKQAIDKKDIGQRKVRIGTNISTIGFGVTGTGLSIYLLIGAFGVALPLLEIANILVTGLIVGVYALKVARNSYSAHADREKQNNVAGNAQELLQQCEVHKQSLVRELEWLRKRIADLPQNDVNAEQLKQLNELTQKYENELKETEKNIRMYADELVNAKQEKMKNERKVAYATIELFGGLVMLSGSILGAGLITIAGLTSFGVIPTVLLFVGFGIGIAAKIFEHLDNKYENKFTMKIRQAGLNIWNLLFTDTPKIDYALEMKELPIFGSTRGILATMPQQENRRENNNNKEALPMDTKEVQISPQSNIAPDPSITSSPRIRR